MTPIDDPTLRDTTNMDLWRVRSKGPQGSNNFYEAGITNNKMFKMGSDRVLIRITKTAAWSEISEIEQKSFPILLNSA